MSRLVPIVVICILSFDLNAQNKDTINWLTFEELETALAQTPKSVFIDFYTDWCVYCKKMDKKIFANPEVIHLINKNYHAVRFNAESEIEVTFGGRTFINDQMGLSRNPLHQMAQLLAIRDGRFVAPTLVILDKDFKVKARYFEYMSSKKLMEALE